MAPSRDSRRGGDFTLAAAGDAIQNRELSAIDDPRVDALLDPIRDADASVVNVEQLLCGMDAGYPTGIGGGGGGGAPLFAPPAIADDLQWQGFDLFHAGNNHSFDLSHGGMEATMRALERRDMPYAGLGRNLGLARAPAYVDTPAGRVALIAVAASPPPGTHAGQARPDFHGRPGVNPLRISSRYVVDDDTFETLRGLSGELGLESVKEQYRSQSGLPAPEDEDDAFTFLIMGGAGPTGAAGAGIRFERGDEPRIELDANREDVEAILDQVRVADRQADWVVASLHVHEGPGGRMSHDVAAFNEAFAHDCVDAGADAVVGHGPHQLRGMECYDGAPIFYSLNCWAQQIETVERFPQETYDNYDLGLDALPADYYDARVARIYGEDHDGVRRAYADPEFWEGLVPICAFEDGDLARIEILPVDLGPEEPRPRRGTPFVARGDRAAEIIDHLRAYSEPFGTDIGFEDGRGVVEP